MPIVHLYPHQQQAIDRLRTGSILVGGVGSGKSITSLAYYFVKVCGGSIREDGTLSELTKIPKLFIITTARKRDTNEWEYELNRFGFSTNKKMSRYCMEAVVDSWNNIAKYVDNSDSFFIFDEDRVVGTGSWAKRFIEISKKNDWIMLSATPGDTWMDYISVFIANGFYKNKTDFIRNHVVFNRFAKYQKVERFINTGRLEKLRRSIIVDMEFSRKTKPIYISERSDYNKDLMKLITVGRWDPFGEKPIQDISGACYLMRKVVNSDPSRLSIVKRLLEKHKKVIIFYNFDYELEALRNLGELCALAEWNGHKHEPIPSADSWVYLVQYIAGAEGWNCIETDTIIFYSQSYSYKAMAQAAGRIDRMNTPFTNLYYYTITSDSDIDKAISRALHNKENFNEKMFFEARKST